jgi:hypothetical protein
MDLDGNTTADPYEIRYLSYVFSNADDRLGPHQIKRLQDQDSHLEHGSELLGPICDPQHVVLASGCRGGVTGRQVSYGPHDAGRSFGFPVH